MIQAVIFELNGVLADVDLCHRRAWKRMAKEQGLPFDDRLYAQIRGMEIQAGLETMLKKARRGYSLGEKMALSARQYDLYADEIATLTQHEMLPGALETLQKLKNAGIRMAVEGTDENVKGILRQLKLLPLMDTVVDAGQVERLKPDPEAFVLVARKLSLPPEMCLAVEDSKKGVEAALRSGMKVAALGNAQDCEQAVLRAESLADIDLAALITAEKI